MKTNIARPSFINPRVSGDVNTPGLGLQKITLDGSTDTLHIEKPIVFNDDYSANYTARSVVDKAYVDAAFQNGIQTGTAAPNTTPDYVGQIFVDTNNGIVYIAVGTTNSSDWDQVSNS